MWFENSATSYGPTRTHELADVVRITADGLTGKKSGTAVD